jgi:hypothetical protein
MAGINSGSSWKPAKGVPKWRPGDPERMTGTKHGMRKDGKVITGYEWGGYDEETGRNLAWDALAMGKKQDFKFTRSQGERTQDWMYFPDNGDGRISRDANNARSKIMQEYGIVHSDGRYQGNYDHPAMIYGYQGWIPIWEDIPEVDVDQSETPIDDILDGADPNKPGVGDGGENLGNPPDAPADDGLHAINDWLLPGEVDVTMLQGFDLFDIGEGGYTQEEVDAYNEQATHYNQWIADNPEIAEEQGMRLEPYELFEFEAVDAPRGSDWEILMADKIDDAKADDIVTQEEINDIWANGIYFPPDEDLDDLTGFLDEQTLREQRKKAREKDGYLSMYRTYGMDLGPLNLGIPGLF